MLEADVRENPNLGSLNPLSRIEDFGIKWNVIEGVNFLSLANIIHSE